MAPIVSVVVPFHNAEAFLAQAIDSVLTQSHQPDEVILVDDGSTDGSAEVASRYAGRVTYLKQSNQGAGPARNVGIGRSTGAFLAFLDADDYWSPTKLEKQMAVLEADRTVEAVFGHAIQFADRGTDGALAANVRVPDEPIAAHVPGAMLIRRDAFLRIGQFKTHVVGQVMDWYVRAREVGLVDRMLPDVVLHRRIHGGNLGLTHRREQQIRLRILKDSLDKRRRGAGA